MFATNKSRRLPEKIFQIILWVITLFFSAFLIGLGELVIRDLPKVSDIPSFDSYKSQELRVLEEKQKLLTMKLQEMRNQLSKDRIELENLQTRYAEEKQSFENWIATRTATGNKDQNEKVVERTQKLDQLKNEISRQSQAIERHEKEVSVLEEGFDDSQIEKLNEKARKAFYGADNHRNLMIFLWRLMVTLPLLLIAGWLFVKKRQSRYWPFIWGFIIFSLVMFFVELVPYLPSYGGYIRYIVGLAVLFIVGYYGINQMQKYLLRKQTEEQKMLHSSQEERRQEFTYEKAFGYIAKGVCPSCERNLSTSADDKKVDFCVHCGLCVYKKCAACHTRVSSFSHFCSSCGESLKT